MSDGWQLAWIWGIALAASVLYISYRRRNSRSLLTGFFLLVAVAFLVFGLFRIGTGHPVALGYAILGVAALMAVAVVLLAVFLILNGVTMLRLEGASLGTSLSLAVGLLLLGMPVATLLVIQLGTGLTYVIGLGLIFLFGYAGLAFALFLTFSYTQGRRTRPEVAARTILVLGSRVIRGQAPPLLASRLDKALEVYTKSRQQLGVAPLIIASGGQGADEARAESAVMAQYLRDHGAAAADVAEENRSTSTRENLELSRQVQTAAGRSGRLVIVTNNYHVLRAALIARRLGVEADVVGAPTARYYVPNAVIREFIATAVDQRKLHLVLLAGPCLALAALLLLSLA